MSVKKVLSPSNFSSIAEMLTEKLEGMPFVLLVDTPANYEQNVSICFTFSKEDTISMLREALDSYNDKPDTEKINGYHSN